MLTLTIPSDRVRSIRDDLVVNLLAFPTSTGVIPIVAADPPSDPELIAAWQGGDENAATTLVRRHALAIGRYLASRGAASDDVEDLVQETFFKAFRGIGGWRGDGQFLGWLFRIGGNLLKDRYRRGGGRIFLEIADHDLIDQADPAAELAAGETADRIRSGLQDLSPMQREVFLLRVEQGLGYDEIARLLDSSPGAARVHYHHAVKRLKERVE